MKKLLLIVSCLLFVNKISIGQNGEGELIRQSVSTPEQDSIINAEKVYRQKVQKVIDACLLRNGHNPKGLKTYEYFTILKNNNNISDSIDLISYNFFGYTFQKNEPYNKYIPQWISKRKEKEYKTAILELRQIKRNKNLFIDNAYQDSIAVCSYRYFWDYNHVYKDKYFNLKYHKTKPYWKGVNTTYLAYVKKSKNKKVN